MWKSSNNLKLVSWRWQSVNCMQTASWFIFFFLCFHVLNLFLIFTLTFFFFFFKINFLSREIFYYSSCSLCSLFKSSLWSWSKLLIFSVFFKTLIFLFNSHQFEALKKKKSRLLIFHIQANYDLTENFHCLMSTFMKTKICNWTF